MNNTPSFKPAWWCPGPHFQSIFAQFFRPVPKLQFERRRIETPDGDFLDLDILNHSPGKPWLVAIHGLEGSSQARYVQSLIGEAHRFGWNAVAANMRGCSGELNRKPYAYHAGKTEDFECIIQYLIREIHPSEIYPAGFSIGGNLILKWLGEHSSGVPKQVVKAAAVSVPYDLVKSTEILDRGLNRKIYTRGMLRTLKQKALHKERFFPGMIDREKVEKANTFMEFDELVTVKVNNLVNAVEYWKSASAVNFLEKIRVPTLLVHSEDDPFYPANLLPREKWRNSAFLNAVVTAGGGHLGFVSGAWPWRQELWLEQKIMAYFK